MRELQSKAEKFFYLLLAKAELQQVEIQTLQNPEVESQLRAECLNLQDIFQSDTAPMLARARAIDEAGLSQECIKIVFQDTESRGVWLTFWNPVITAHFPHYLIGEDAIVVTMLVWAQIAETAQPIVNLQARELHNIHRDFLVVLEQLAQDVPKQLQRVERRDADAVPGAQAAFEWAELTFSRSKQEKFLGPVRQTAEGYIFRVSVAFFNILNQACRDLYQQSLGKLPEEAIKEEGRPEDDRSRLLAGVSGTTYGTSSSDPQVAVDEGGACCHIL